MTLRVLFSAAAQQDVAAAKEWYAKQLVPNLDVRFRDELERILGKIESVPLGFPVVYQDIRRANLHRFPYSVFYHQRSGRQGGDQLFVLAVVHHARHPRVWQRRR